MFNLVFTVPWFDLAILFASSSIILVEFTLFPVNIWKVIGLGLLSVLSDYLYVLLHQLPLGALGLLLFAVLSYLALIRTGRPPHVNFKPRIFVVLLGLLGVIEASALPHWVFYPLETQTAAHAAEMELQFFFVPYSLERVVYMLFLFSWILFPVLLFYEGQRQPRFQTRSVMPPSSLWYIVLSAGILLGLFLSVYPYLTMSGRLVGVDIDCCYRPNLEIVIDSGPLSGPPDRVLFWVFLWVLHATTSLDPSQILWLLTPTFIVATALASFLLVIVGTGDKLAGAWAALLSALFFNTTAAFYMDLFAMWLAVIVALLYFATLVRTLRFERNWTNYAFLSIVLSVAVMLLHPYSWEIIMIVTVLFVCSRTIVSRCIPSKTFRGRSFQFAAYLPVLFGVNLLVYYQRTSSGAFGSGAGMGVSMVSLSSFQAQPLSLAVVASKLADPARTLGTFWFNFDYFLRIAGVHYADWLIPLLGLTGVVWLFRRDLHGSFSTLLFAWLFVSSGLAVLMGNFAAPYTNQYTYMPLVWRAFMLTPFQIPAGVAVAGFKGKFGYGLLCFVVVVVMLNHALRTLAMLTLT